MLARSVAVSAAALFVLAFAVPGRAQEPPVGGGSGPAPEVLPAPSGGGSGPASEVPEKPKAPTVPAAGYAYGDKTAKATSGGPGRPRFRKQGPVVNMPGFEPTGDGGSRLFVQLSENVPVEEHKAQGTITYVLKGASPRVWNNTNALVTVHFNTPVTRARLVPHGHDLHFVVELRSAVNPTWKMNEGAEKSAMLAIDFPKGDYLQTPTEAPSAQAAPAAAAKPPAKATARKRAPAKK